MPAIALLGPLANDDTDFINPAPSRFTQASPATHLDDGIVAGQLHARRERG
jgi:hypothetical protein